jgi:hypothetical protein
MVEIRKSVRFLGIVYYVLAVIAALLGCFFAGHVRAGLHALFGSEVPEEAMLVTFLGLMGGAALFFAWALAVLFGLTGWFLRGFKHRVFCIVVAALTCIMCFPVGPAVGIWMLVLLTRDSARALFQTEEDHAETGTQARDGATREATDSGPGANDHVFSLVSDTFFGPNLRARDNWIQAAAVAVSGVVGAAVGALLAGGEYVAGAIIGVLAGIVAGLFLSGSALAIYRLIRHIRGEHD